MIPVRLTLLLIGAIAILLLVFANPQTVTLNFLFWTGRFSLYKIIIASVVLGIILALIYVGHVRYLRKIRSRYK